MGYKIQSRNNKERAMKNKRAIKNKVETGTMLYDYGMNRIGWVLKKRDWKTRKSPDEHKDWDVVWSDGKRTYFSESILHLLINNYKDMFNQLTREK
jgi:hypothetical protein